MSDDSSHIVTYFDFLVNDIMAISVDFLKKKVHIGYCYQNNKQKRKCTEMETTQSAETPVIIPEDCEIRLSLSSREHSYEETDITKTYGIAAVFTDSDGNSSEKIINDVSSVKENVERIINILTENRVSYFHLEAVIEDILFEENILFESTIPY